VNKQYQGTEEAQLWQLKWDSEGVLAD